MLCHCGVCLLGESPVKLRKRKAKEDKFPEPDAQTSPVVARRSSRRHSKRQVLQSDDEDEVQHVDVKQQVSIGPQPCTYPVSLLAQIVSWHVWDHVFKSAPLANAFYTYGTSHTAKHELSQVQNAFHRWCAHISSPVCPFIPVK